MPESNKPLVPQRGRIVLYLMTFIMGGCGIAYEYTLSKVSSDLLGNSVQQWAVTIGLMMFFMGIGADLQKHLRDRDLMDLFIFYEILLGVLGAIGPLLLIFCFGFWHDHFVLIQYLLISSIGLLIGLELPILTRINQSFTPELKANIGGILRMDYIGAFLGALGWVFILPRFFSLIQMSFVLGVFNLLTAGLALFYFRNQIRHSRALGAAILLLSLALGWGCTLAPSWTRYSEQQLYLDPIIYSNTTKYQHIVLTKSSAGDLYCYINGNTQFASYDEHIYHEFLTHPALLIAPHRKNVLILGGGDGLALREVLKYPDIEAITLVDLDPDMTTLARDNPELARLNENSLAHAKVHILENHALVEDPDRRRTIYNRDRSGLFPGEPEAVAEVALVNLDAANFVEQISGVYDVIIIDFPDPSNLELAKLYSETFYRRLYAKLSRDGILVQQSTSPVFSREAFLCIGRTLQASGFSVLPFHEHVPSFGEWGWWIAAKAEVYHSEELRERLRAIDQIPYPVRYLTPDLVRSSLAFGKGLLETPREEINTLVNNVIFQFYHQP